MSLNALPKLSGMPAGVVLEKSGRNLDSLVETDALKRLKSTLIHEWKIRNAFKPLEQYGIRPTTLALFHGPPGNGKTMAAKQLAAVTGVPLYRVACDGLMASYLGELERNMRNVLDWLAQAGPAVVLFDECEAIFRRRGACDSGGALAIVRAMQIFWQAVDRWESPQVFLLATNQIEEIDAALISRCETRLEFVGPTAEQAKLVIEYWSEVLHEYGANFWSKELLKAVDKTPPESFRDIWNAVAACVRKFITSNQ